MKGFNQCGKGHFYKEELDACPYCPGNSSESQKSNSSSDKTQIVGGGMDTKIPASSGNDKTQIFGGGGQGSGDGKTQIFGGGKGAGAARDLSKTFISGVDEDDAESGKKKARATRKITGWIVSYTMDSMGVDFRIYEGKNRIGKDPALEITITTDQTVSANHAVLLFRNNVWYLEDEMSANGTYVDGAELRPRNPVELKDNDVIKVGNTEFKFKTAI